MLSDNDSSSRANEPLCVSRAGTSLKSVLSASRSVIIRNARWRARRAVMAAAAATAAAAAAADADMPCVYFYGKEGWHP